MDGFYTMYTDYLLFLGSFYKFLGTGIYIMNRFISDFVVASYTQTVFCYSLCNYLILTLQQQNFTILENVYETGDTHERDKSVISDGTEVLCVNNVKMIFS